VTVDETVDVDSTLAALADRRGVFHSEADFQFGLATILHELYPYLEIRLEVPIAEKITLDMLLIEPTTGDRFAVELKYKTALWVGSDHGEEFNLRNHGADDIGSYDVLKDVERIESLASAGLVTSGAVIFLTNEPLYWKERTEGASKTNAHEFRVHEGLMITGTRSWGPNTGGSSKGREQPLSLRGNYPIQWRNYSDVQGRRGQFRHLVFRVTGIGS
jgi:hypothetical protein